MKTIHRPSSVRESLPYPNKHIAARVIAVDLIYQDNERDGVLFPLSSADESVGKMFNEEVYAFIESRGYRYSKVGVWHKVKAYDTLS